MESRPELPKSLVRGATGSSNFGGLGDSMLFCVSEGQESEIPPVEEYRAKKAIRLMPYFRLALMIPIVPGVIVQLIAGVRDFELIAIPVLLRLGRLYLGIFGPHRSALPGEANV